MNRAQITVNRYLKRGIKPVLCALLSVNFALFFSINANAFIEKNNATVRIMNKAAGQVQTITLPVGVATDFEKLNITIQTCKQTDAFEPLDFWMFAQVAKNSDGEIFSGWMNRNDPGDNPLQDADYDLWLIKCE